MSESNDNDDLEGKVVEKILKKGLVDNGERLESVVDWFSDEEQDNVKELLLNRPDDDDFPVEVENVNGNNIVYVPDNKAEEAYDFARENYNSLDDSWI